MNKEQLEQDIQVMKDKLASMEAELNKPDVELFWKPDDKAWYVDRFTTGDRVKCDSYASARAIELGAYYKTKEEAQKELNLLLAKQRVKEAIWYLNGGKFLEFIVEEDNYCFELYRDKIISSRWNARKCYPNWQYFVSPEAVEKLIKTHHDDLMLIRSE